MDKEDLQIEKFDLVVVGSGPAGERAAIQAAKLKKRVAIIERRAVVGGVCVHTGTLPSKTLRETSLFYDGLKKRSFYGINLSLREGVSVQELMHRKNIVVKNELAVIERNLKRNGITVFGGRGQFIDEHQIAILDDEETIATLEFEYAIIATGTRPRRLPGLEYESGRVFDGESILQLRRIPQKMVVLGGGVIGCEWASIFSKLGISVTLIDRQKRMLAFLDHGFADRLFGQMRNDGVEIILGDRQREITEDADGVTVKLESGKQVRGEVLLVAAGRVGNTDDLALKNVGLRPNEHGLLEVNHEYRTETENVFAVGDVIGFPSLASTSADQGRLAARAAFLGSDSCSLGTLLPFGIYTIPEISYVGETEESLKAKNIPYEVGIAYYYELPRGQINNDHEGALKLLFDPLTLRLHGVHIIGSRATEIVHLGQAVMAFGGTLEYFIDTVTNFPTMTEAYKVAALNGINRMRGEKN